MSSRKEPKVRHIDSDLYLGARKEPKVRRIDSDLYLGARKESKVIDIWTVTSS